MPQRAPNATFWLKKNAIYRDLLGKKKKKKGVLLTPDAALSKQSLPWALKARCGFSCISAALASLFGFLGQRDHRGDHFFFFLFFYTEEKKGKASAAVSLLLPEEGRCLPRVGSGAGTSSQVMLKAQKNLLMPAHNGHIVNASLPIM